jgi:hypothetical protein
MTMQALASAHQAINQKASTQGFKPLGYELIENFGGYQGNLVLSAYGPNGEKVYTEIK